MDIDKPVIYIETFNINSENKNASGRVIYDYNISDATAEFTNWSTNLENNSFKIVSFNYPCSVTLTIYNASLSITNEPTIVCLLMVDKLKSEVSYKLINDLENIIDIIPMVAKISNGSITHFSNKNIMVIFDQLMRKVDTKFDRLMPK